MRWVFLPETEKVVPKCTKTYYSLSWKTNFNKTFLLLLAEQIFRLVEISFRNSDCLLLWQMATVTVSCRSKLLMQSLVPPNIN